MKTQLLIIDDFGIGGIDVHLGPILFDIIDQQSMQDRLYHQPVSAGEVVRPVQRPDRGRCHPGSDCASGAFHGIEGGIDVEGSGEEELIYRDCHPAAVVIYSKSVVRSGEIARQVGCVWVVNREGDFASA